MDSVVASRRLKTTIECPLVSRMLLVKNDIAIINVVPRSVTSLRNAENLAMDTHLDDLRDG